MFPLLLKDSHYTGSEKKSVYYLLAENGLYLFKDVNLYKASVKVEGFPGLLSHSESIELKFPKIPQQVIERAMGFFYEVFYRYRSEAIVLLFYSQSEGFKIGIPEQFVDRWNSWNYQYGVRYKNFPTPHGFYRMGTWHSHCELPASHSAVDDLDEENEDGLHIVCGNLNWEAPSFSVSFVVNGRRFLLNEDRIFEGYSKPILPPPEKWLKKIKVLEPDSGSPFYYLPKR